MKILSLFFIIVVCVYLANAQTKLYSFSDNIHGYPNERFSDNSTGYFLTEKNNIFTIRKV